METKSTGTRKIGRRLTFCLLAAFIIGSSLARFSPPSSTSAQTGVTISLSPSKDNTLYESASGATSNGAGSHFFAGENNSGDLRRGVIAFDLAAGVPAGSFINSVTLTLTVSRTMAGTVTVSLHRLTANWGEGASNADLNEGMGAPATTGDATWIHTFFNTSQWAAAGGDFAALASANQSVGSLGSYTWGSTPQMVADAQAWLDNPSANFGWLVLGSETALQTTKRFDSRQNAVVANRPRLEVNYSPLESSLYLPVVLLTGNLQR